MSVLVDRRSVAKTVDHDDGLLGLSEFNLVAAAKNGYGAAFVALCRPHTKRLLRSTYRITRNREDAEDALQNSFLRAFVHIQKFDGRSTFSTWLTRIAINSALMILRKRRNSRETGMEVPEELGVKKGGCDVAEHDSNPERKCAQSEIGYILQAAIRDLRPTIRVVVETRYLQEFSVRETAGKIGISVAAAKARLFHGRSALRKALTSRVNQYGGDGGLGNNADLVCTRTRKAESGVMRLRESE